MTPEALPNYALLGIGMLMCLVPFLIVALFTYCAVVVGAQADRRKENLLAQKYSKGNDGGSNA